MNSNVATVLNNLRKFAEGCESNGWRDVYLDNARPEHMTDKTFRACLASLAKQGLYKPLDGYAFGMIKMGA